LIEAIRTSVIDGNAPDAEALCRQALKAGIDALVILNDGIMAGADIVGKRFESGEFFLPELMLTGRALKAAMKTVTPTLGGQHTSEKSLDTGSVVIATVKTDIHDIGKNMVASMLTASGFTVTDLGVDVAIKDIIAKAQELEANVIACSALLTTSMPFIRDFVGLLEAMGERQRFKVMVGGAPVTAEFAEKIGADGTAPNAIKAVQLARRLIRAQHAERGVPTHA
jgi:corrinoid protein of di/trimethylamine methyltransferase